MSTLVPDEISMEDPLCDSSFGTMVTLDYVNPLTLSLNARVRKLRRDDLMTTDMGKLQKGKNIIKPII